MYANLSFNVNPNRLNFWLLPKVLMTMPTENVKRKAGQRGGSMLQQAELGKPSFKFE